MGQSGSIHILLPNCPLLVGFAVVSKPRICWAKLGTHMDKYQQPAFIIAGVFVH